MGLVWVCWSRREAWRIQQRGQESQRGLGGNDMEVGTHRRMEDCGMRMGLYLKNGALAGPGVTVKLICKVS